MNNIFLNLYYLLIINFSKINIITSIRYFLYHEENNWIKKFCIYIFKNNKDIWRVKPKVKSSGKTIDNDFTDIKSDNYIIAKFIYNSHPIKGSKYIYSSVNWSTQDFWFFHPYQFILHIKQNIIVNMIITLYHISRIPF